MKTFSDVIDAFGGPNPFGEAIGVAPSHARTMKARDSIPPARSIGGFPRRGTRPTVATRSAGPPPREGRTNTW